MYLSASKSSCNASEAEWQSGVQMVDEKSTNNVEVAPGCLTLSKMVSTSTDCSAAMADDCLSTWASVMMLAAVRS